MTLFEILKNSGDEGYVNARREIWSDMWVHCQGYYDSILVCVPSSSGGEYRFSWNPDPCGLLADDWEVFE